MNILYFSSLYNNYLALDLAKKYIQTSIFRYIRTITNRFDTQLIAKKLILEIDSVNFMQ